MKKSLLKIGAILILIGASLAHFADDAVRTSAQFVDDTVNISKNMASSAVGGSRNAANVVKHFSKKNQTLPIDIADRINSFYSLLPEASHRKSVMIDMRHDIFETWYEKRNHNYEAIREKGIGFAEFYIDDSPPFTEDLTEEVSLPENEGEYDRISFTKKDNKHGHLNILISGKKIENGHVFEFQEQVGAIIKPVEYKFSFMTYSNEEEALKSLQNENISYITKDGTNVGWVEPAHVMNEFQEELITMKKGDVSAAPIKTETGWHIIFLEDIRKSSEDNTLFIKIESDELNKLTKKLVNQLIKQMQNHIGKKEQKHAVHIPTSESMHCQISKKHAHCVQENTRIIAQASLWD